MNRGRDGERDRERENERAKEMSCLFQKVYLVHTIQINHVKINHLKPKNRKKLYNVSQWANKTLPQIMPTVNACHLRAPSILMWCLLLLLLWSQLFTASPWGNDNDWLALMVSIVVLLTSIWLSCHFMPSSLLPLLVVSIVCLAAFASATNHTLLLAILHTTVAIRDKGIIKGLFFNCNFILLLGLFIFLRFVNVGKKHCL